MPKEIYKTETEKNSMPNSEKSKITRKQLIEGLNEDLSREYQAIISYVNYSQVLKGAVYEYRGRIGRSCEGRTLARAKDIQSCRLSWRHAIRYAEAREDLGRKRRKCFGLIWRMRRKRSANTGVESSKRMS
jgi:hypothetical protein